MIKFELKKLLKQKLILILMFFSFSIVFYSAYLSKNLGVNRSYNDLEIGMPKYINEYFKFSFENRYNPKYDLNQEKKDIEAKAGSVIIMIQSIEDGEYENFNNLYNEIIDYSVHLRDVYDLEKDERSDNLIEWSQFDSNYSMNNDVYSTSNLGSNLTTNYSRVLIYNFSLLFGLPAMIFFIFVFSSTFPGEYKNDTNLFLLTQPINRKKIIAHKIISNMALVLLYLILTLIFTIIIYVGIFKYSFDGFSEIYRVFSKASLSSYELAYVLIIKMILSYIAMSLFVVSIISLLGIRTKDTIKTVGTCLAIFAIMYLLEKSIAGLQNWYNPVYALDYLKIFKGNIEYIRLDGATNIKYLFNQSLMVYLPYLILGIVFILISLFSDLSVKKSIKNSTETKNKTSMFSFELGKITNNNQFSYLLTLSLFICIGMFGIFYLTFSNKIKEENNEYNLKRYERTVNWTEDFITVLENQKKGQTDPNEIEHLNIGIDMYKYNLEIENYMYDLYKDESKSKKLGDSKKFYETKLKLVNYFFGEDHTGHQRTTSEFLVRNKYSGHSYDETRALYSYARDNNIKTYATGDVKSSEYELYKTDEFRKMELENQFPLSTSGFQTLQYFSILKNFNTVLILIVVIVVIGGYTFDREHGDQVLFMYTQPVKRRKYYFDKIKSSFLISIFLVLGIYLLLFILGSITEGAGDYRYPIIKYFDSIENTINYFKVINLWNYLIELVVLSIFQILFVISLGIFISLFTKTRLQLISILIMVIGVGFFITSVLNNEMIKMILPFLYIDIDSVARGSIIVKNNLVNYKEFYPYLSLGISSILLMIINIKLLNKEL